MMKKAAAAALAFSLAFSCGTTVFGADMTIQNINKAISSVEDVEGQVDIESADENKVVFNVDNLRYVYLFDGVDDEILEVHIIDTDHEFDEDDYDVYFIDDEYEYVDYEYDSDIDYESLVPSLDALDIACEELEPELDDDEKIVAKTVGLVWTKDGGDLIYDIRILTDKGAEHEYELEAYTGNIYERETYSTQTVTRGRSTQSRYFYGLENGKYRKYKYEQPVVIVVTKAEEPPKDVLPKEEPPKEELPKEELPKDELPKDELPKDELPKDELPKDELPKDEPSEPESKPVEEPVSEVTTAEAAEEITTAEAAEDIPAVEITTIEAPEAEPSTKAAEEPVTKAEPATEEPVTKTEKVTLEPASEITTEAVKPVEKATEKAVEKQTEKTTQKAAERTTQKSVEKTTPKVSEKAPETTTRQQNITNKNSQNQANQNNQPDMFGRNSQPFGRR